MSSTVCQELPSFLEPTHIEPRALIADSDPPKPEPFPNTSVFSAAKPAQNADIGGWTFLQSLTKPKDTDGYVHPMEKRSTPILSDRSLEMCTENLGSETGSDISEEMLMLSMETTNYNPTKSRKEISKRVIRSNTFPPPLTSISTSNGVEMRSYREDGRLVLEVVPSPSPYTYFQEERTHGRLRLSLLKESDIDEEEEAEEAETEEVEEEEEYVEEDGEGNCGNCGVEEISRRNRSRCTEGGRGQRSIMNWEPFWVAT